MAHEKKLHYKHIAYHIIINLMSIPFLGHIYWTDTGERKIQRCNKGGENIELIIGKGLHTADGIVIDSSGRKVPTNFI